MSKTVNAAIIIIIILLLGGWYWYDHQPQSAMQEGANGPSQAAGINGSPNQGNLGQPDNGQVQQPGADGAEGSIIGANLALGTDASSDLGTYLIGYNGMTVYTYDKDSVGTTTCYGKCAQNWPPYLVGAEDNVAQLQSGVTGKTGTITRADGTLQMTYNGKPLYFYAGDSASAKTAGNGVGGVWHVVKP